MMEKSLRRILVSLLFLAGWLPAAARAQDLELLLDNGVSPIAWLVPGDHLRVGVRGAVPGASYQLRLIGPGDSLIASVEADADGDGSIASRMVWPFSGVTGCDCGASPAASFAFQTFEQAEAALGEGELTVQVLDPDGAEVAQTSLPVRTANEEKMFFSDAEGCPRSIFEPGEPVYLSFLYPDRSKPHRLLFISELFDWPFEVPLADLRGAPEWTTLPPSGGLRITVPVDLGGLFGPGPYFGLVRKSDPAAAQDPYRCQGDTPVPLQPLPEGIFPEGAATGGIVISMDGCLGGQSPPVDWGTFTGGGLSAEKPR